MIKDRYHGVEKGTVVGFKVSSGEEIIGILQGELNNDTYILQSTKVLIADEQGLVLYNYPLMSVRDKGDDLFYLNKSNIIGRYPVDSQFKSLYIKSFQEDVTEIEEIYDDDKTQDNPETKH